jgi:hypothetical protein
MNSTDMTRLHIADLAGDLDLHTLRPGTDRCIACNETSPCGTHLGAVRALYLIGYMRSVAPDHPLRDRAHHITWLREEIRRREAVHTDSADYDIVRASLDDLRDRLAASEAHLINAVHGKEPRTCRSRVNRNTSRSISEGQERTRRLA